VGALNAAYYAGDPTVAGMARLDALWRGLKRRDVFPRPSLRALAGVLRGRSHLVAPDALRELLERELPVRQFDALRISCAVVATDLLDGLEVRIQSGDLVPALLASAAIPGFLPPVRLANRVLIDGGMANQAPIAASVTLGAMRLVLLPTGYSCTRRDMPTSATGIALQGFNILTIGKLVSAIRHFSASVKIDVVPPLCPLDVSPVDFSRSAELIDRAESSTLGWLDKGVKLVEGMPHQLPLHSHDVARAPYEAHVV
jgi:NTE family protein